jgi:hypothetical protein
MNAIRPIAVGLAVLAVALAGCTGGFTVNQTEPIRVQIEGQPQTVVVHDTDKDPQKVVLKACDSGCDDVQVNVQVKKLADGPCRLHVIIQDEDGNTLEERDVDVDQEGSSSGSGSMTTTATGNETGNGTSSTPTTSASSGGTGTTIVQNFVVNIKGKQNVVVLTQAIQGSAEVQVNTANANGHNSVSQGNTAGNTTVTTSDTNSTSGYP